MHKADRLFQLVNLIRVHQPITAERLAERLGVSVRSIYRYIDDLSLSGVPVYGTTGVGYALDAAFEMPPLRLSRIEVDALTLGMEMLAGSADPQLAGAARTLLSKVSATAPEQRIEPRQSPVRAPGSIDATTRGHLSTLRQAIEHKRVLQITYTSLDGTVSHRLIQPIGLFYWGGKWTVGSWCSTRAAYRDFRVDRIASIITSEAPWHDSPQIALRTYMRHQSSHGRTDNTLAG
ncbi:YafY family protein [Pseudomonas japonica]|uniref:helix-turn-helix transcriptional regulator n=1 Tax=Pseudomonas TaxID=286 RepID=UPI002928F3B0|nr:YafY family protein [Pseudomonas sp. zfem002]MDU9394046.1 YafY family protein [Pseudomonas sp. zfem002]